MTTANDDDFNRHINVRWSLGLILRVALSQLSPFRKWSVPS